ncbi:MAG: hypothetical protein L3J44_00410 [Campylobacteraceae bacterium]|nr:hypothetical protein [Campylobacteraceae bacterium]
MSKEITLSFRWDKDTYMQAGEYAYDYKMYHTPKKYLGWIFIALLQFGVVGALLKGTLAILLFSTIMIIYWYYLKIRIERWYLVKKFDSEKDANRLLKIFISDKDIDINGKKLLWSEIPLIIASEKGYLLDHISGYIFFPNKAFKKEEDKTNFIKIAKRKGSYIQRVQKSTNQFLAKK